MGANRIAGKSTRKLKEALSTFTANAFALLLVLFLIRIFEIFFTGHFHSFPSSLPRLIGLALLFDVLFWLKLCVIFFVIYFAVFLINKRAASVFFVAAAIIVAVIQLALVQYFNRAMVPLGADLYGYKLSDIKQTVGASGGIPVASIIIALLAIALFVIIFRWLPAKVRVSKIFAGAFILLCVLLFIINPGSKIRASGFETEFVSNEALNKSDFFFAQSYEHFFPKENEPDIYSDSYIGDYGNAETKAVSFHYIDEDKYPFLHIDSTPDVLSPFFEPSETPPNIVIILVEGLGRAFTNEGAYLGNFTPFIDSLSQHSLYWSNFLSNGGRTFAVLPSLLGSLPFAKSGFNELGDNMPPHLSLLSLLKHNGYVTSFNYGGEAKFDNMNLFLKKNSIDNITEQKTFPPSYSLMPSHNGFTWGYGDKELYRLYLENNKASQKPRLDIFLTLSTHDPFYINEQDKYIDLFHKRIAAFRLDNKKAEEYENYKSQFASILYADDALKSFMSIYSTRSDFKNTIFLITGDHRMPEIPMVSKIDRYHVPFIIYSPLLKRAAKFASVSSHFDIAPSLIAFMKHRYNLDVPSLASWMGEGLDTSRALQNNHVYPLMQTKNDLVDFVMNSYQLNGENLYQVGQDLTLAPAQDKDVYTRLTAAFNRFKSKNNMLINGAPLIPDSIYQKYYPH